MMIGLRQYEIESFIKSAFVSNAPVTPEELAKVIGELLIKNNDKIERELKEISTGNKGTDY